MNSPTGRMPSTYVPPFHELPREKRQAPNYGVQCDANNRLAPLLKKGLEAMNPVSNVITFNTGRWYAEAGQRVAAMLTSEGAILFVDADRNIDGYIPREYVTGRDMQFNQASIMDVYDFQRVDYWATKAQHYDELRLLRWIAHETAPKAKG
jgi:hypothetical protein